MEIFLIRLLQFVLAISLLVFLHEGGHMFFSKLFGIRVEKFFIFFDMSIGKWSGKLFSFKPKTSDTEYGVGWLPLGGYCKIAGMIDESFDKEQMAKPAQPWEFRSKPAWQRLLVMIGGVLVNFLLALFIYSMVLFVWGEQFVPTKDMTMGMKFNKEAKALGFADHDILLGTDLGTFKDFNIDLVRELSEATRVDIIRDGKHISLHLPGNLNLLDMIKQSPRFVAPYIPSEVALTEEGSPAQKAGIAKGDRIIALNGTRIETWNEFQDIMAGLNKKLEDAKTGSDSREARSTKRSRMSAKMLSPKISEARRANHVKMVCAITAASRKRTKRSTSEICAPARRSSMRRPMRKGSASAATAANECRISTRLNCPLCRRKTHFVCAQTCFGSATGKARANGSICAAVGLANFGFLIRGDCVVVIRHHRRARRSVDRPGSPAPSPYAARSPPRAPLEGARHDRCARARAG